LVKKTIAELLIMRAQPNNDDRIVIIAGLFPELVISNNQFWKELGNNVLRKIPKLIKATAAIALPNNDVMRCQFTAAHMYIGQKRRRLPETDNASNNNYIHIVYRAHIKIVLSA
jgi:hypothetical protein